LIEKHMHPLEKNVMYRSTLFSRPSKAFKWCNLPTIIFPPT
jgi:hypothetical protein